MKEANTIDLAHRALSVAVDCGASYVDVRVLRQLRQDLSCEDERVSGISDSKEMGVGIRVIADGAWGFAASGNMSRGEVERIARQAVEVARASATIRLEPVRLIPELPRKMDFRSECAIDPFTVPTDRKAGLLLEINQRLLRHSGIKKAYACMTLRKHERLLVTSDGSELFSEVYTTAAPYQATAVAMSHAQSRSYELPPRTMGYENIDASDLLANTERVAEQAMEKLHAPESPAGIRDIILDPLNLALTMHESVGHATELDRVLGMEESLAGRSFATPEKLHAFRYGSPIVNFVADNTLPRGLATWGFDDDGVEGQCWYIVKDGILTGYATSREVAGAIGLQRSTGACRADHWSSIPLIRIPNLSLTPGAHPLTPEELIAYTRDDIYIEGMGSFSIDQMRCNFQFGGDAFWEVRNGKLTHMLKNVTYQSITSEFWNSCDAICDERFWVPHGVLTCGKGDPVQIAQMTHGASPARFRRIAIGRKAFTHARQ